MGHPQSNTISSSPRHIWAKRFYDFNVWSQRKEVEKLRYMHQNPVKRGLVVTPEAWPWSSYRTYTFNERNPVNMDWHFPPFNIRLVPLPDSHNLE